MFSNNTSMTGNLRASIWELRTFLVCPPPQEEGSPPRKFVDKGGQYQQRSQPSQTSCFRPYSDFVKRNRRGRLPKAHLAHNTAGAQMTGKLLRDILL